AAETCLAQAENLDPREPRWPYYQAIARHQEEPDLAIPKLRRAVELFDEDSQAPRLLLAEVLYAQGRADEATSQFEHILKRDPNNARAHLGLGRLAYHRGKFNDSLQHLNHAKTDSRTRKASVTLAIEVDRRLGDKAAADQGLRELASIPDDQPWP